MMKLKVRNCSQIKGKVYSESIIFVFLQILRSENVMFVIGLHELYTKDIKTISKTNMS